MKLINHFVLTPNLQVKLACVNENNSHRILVNFENGSDLIHHTEINGEGELDSDECAVILGDEVNKFLLSKEWSLYTVKKSRIIGGRMIPVLIHNEEEKLVEYHNFINSPRFSHMNEIEQWALKQDLDKVQVIRVYNEYGFLIDVLKVEHGQ